MKGCKHHFSTQRTAQRPFDIRELWKEKELPISLAEWFDGILEARRIGDRHATRFVARHLFEIGVNPVMRGVFHDDGND
jgi:hypothetical protein